MCGMFREIRLYQEDWTTQKWTHGTLMTLASRKLFNLACKVNYTVLSYVVTIWAGSSVFSFVTVQISILSVIYIALKQGGGCYPTKYCGNNILFSPYSPTLHIKWYASYSKVKSMYTSLRQQQRHFWFKMNCLIYCFLLSKIHHNTIFGCETHFKRKRYFNFYQPWESKTNSHLMYIYLQWLKVPKNPIKVWYIDLVKCEVFSEQLLMSKYTSNPCHMEKGCTSVN